MASSVSKNQIIRLGGLPNAPLVVKRRGRRYLSLPLAGGRERLLLPIVREDERYYTLYNPLVSRGLVPLLKIPKNRDDVAVALSLAAFV